MPRGNRFRITGGEHRGRTLQAPLNIKTRPMQGFLREALFNIIGTRLMKASVLDLFSGTGSIGLEALSRGAASCVFFEHHRTALAVLRRNIRSLGLESKTRVFQKDLLRLKEIPPTGLEPYELIFLDPPFSFHDPETEVDLAPLIQRLQKQRTLSDPVLLVLQLRKKQSPPAELADLTLEASREYGSVTLNFYS